jgi:hypothetical protein
MNPWARLAIPGALIVVFVFLAYLPALRGGFVWDDEAYVTNNPLLTAPDGLKRIWFSTESPSQYFPLTYMTFRIERALWGLNPAGYHWVNLLLHAANALLVWRLLKRLSVPGAWLAAAIFALHPVQVESVAWIAERKNVLMCFFFLLTLRVWVGFVEGGKWRFYWLALAFYALALCSKTTACTLPAALLLILWLKGRPIDWQRLAQAVPFLVMGLGMGLLTMWWERYHIGTQGKLFSLGLPERVLVASHAVWFYLGKLFWPVNLTFSYPHWTINAANPSAYGWLVMGIGLGTAIYFTRRFVGRGVEVATLFYVATLCPLLGFVMLYTFRYTFVADHYQYVACLGPIALVAALVMRAAETMRTPAVIYGFAAIVLPVLALLTWRQAGMYTDMETLWRTTLARNPGCWMAYNNLGVLRRDQGRIEEAMELYHKSIEINPNNSEAQYNLGTALAAKGRFDEAIKNFRMAIQINPNFSEALNNLAWVLATSPKAELRDGTQAVQLAERACELTHYGQPAFLGTLAAAYAECGRFPEAVTTAERAEQLATTAGLKKLAGKNRQLLELYRAGKPYHEPAPMGQ